MVDENIKFVDSDIAEIIVNICLINKELDKQFDSNEVQKIKQFFSCNKQIKNETNNLLSANGIDEFKDKMQSFNDYINEMLIQSQKLAINFNNKPELVSLLYKLNQTLLKLNNKFI